MTKIAIHKSKSSEPERFMFTMYVLPNYTQTTSQDALGLVQSRSFGVLTYRQKTPKKGPSVKTHLRLIARRLQ